MNFNGILKERWLISICTIKVSNLLICTLISYDYVDRHFVGCGILQWDRWTSTDFCKLIYLFSKIVPNFDTQWTPRGRRMLQTRQPLGLEAEPGLRGLPIIGSRIRGLLQQKHHVPISDTSDPSCIMKYQKMIGFMFL